MMRLRILLVLLWHCSAGIQADEPQQKILSIEANCTRDLMHVKINMGRPFKGMVFAKGFSDECGSVPGNLIASSQTVNTSAYAIFHLRRFAGVDHSTFIVRHQVEVSVERQDAILGAVGSADGFEAATED